MSYLFGIILILGSLVFGLFAITFLLSWLKSHRLRIRDLTNNNKYIRDFWIIEKKDKETGAIFWQSVFFQPKIKIPKPSMEIIDVGNRGRMYAEAYVLESSADGDTQVAWIKDKGFKSDTKLNDGQIIENAFSPFSVTERSFFVDEFKKSQSKRAKRWDLQRVVNTAAIGMIAMSLLVGIIFAPDIITEWKVYQGEKEKWMDTALEVSQYQAAIMQSMGKNMQGIDVQVTQKAKAEKDNTVATKGETPPETN